MKLFYLTVVPVIGLAVAFMSLSARFGRPEFRSIRASIFVAFGLSITVPFMHWFWSSSNIHINLMNVGLVGLLYVGGALLYAGKHYHAAVMTQRLTLESLFVRSASTRALVPRQVRLPVSKSSNFPRAGRCRCVDCMPHASIVINSALSID